MTICSGVVLLQLSKSAKDVPDSAVFAGDLDQIQTIAEQPQPETEPKADAIRGAAAIVRRLSSARQKMEMEELKRLHEERLQETLEPVSENGVPTYEWDGLRRRRTGTLNSSRSRPGTSPGPPFLSPPTPHPPLGWSHFPTEEELAEANRPVSPALSSLVGTIRSRARSVLLPGHPDYKAGPNPSIRVHSPLQPVQLTSVSVAGTNPEPYEGAAGVHTPRRNRAGTMETGGSVSSSKRVQFGEQQLQQEGNTEFAAGSSRNNNNQPPPTPPQHSARRQFSFQNIFRRNQAHHEGSGHDGALEGAGGGPNRAGLSSRGYSAPQVSGSTEEERLGLVKDRSRASKSVPSLQRFLENDDEDDDEELEDGELPYADDKKASRYGHSITKPYDAHSPPRGRRRGSSLAKDIEKDELKEYEERRRNFERRTGSGSSSDESGRDLAKPLPKPPPHGGGKDQSKGSEGRR